ncbi:fibronectin type III domain-containing protein, partial [Bacillus sp. SIMBA_006]
WDAIQNSNNFLVKYRVSGSNVWTSVAVTGNTATLEPLVPCTPYEVQVTEVSSGENSSSVFFSTYKNYCTSSSIDPNIGHLSNV